MSNGAYLLIGLVIGGGIGALIGWLLAVRRQPIAPPPDTRLEEELRLQLNQRDEDIVHLRTALAECGYSRATAEARRDASEQMLLDQKQLHEQALRDTKAAQEKALADLREAFRALSADALKQSAPDFLRLAEQTFGKLQATAKGDLAERQEAIKGLVEPLKTQLENYQRRLQQSETSQAGVLGEVKKQLESLTQTNQSLAAETAQFRSVLKSNQARGKWGEETLRRVVEAAGMSAHCDFTEQTTAGENRPDLIVKLPGDRFIIVDAKVPDLNFLGGLDSADETTRSQALAEHAAKLKTTIKQLADRDYPAQFKNTLDYVVLFVPAESLFSAALEGDHELIVWAAGKKILLATPASLIALLRSVSVSWQQHAQTENAQKIADAAREFYARVVKFSEHFETIGAGLERANSAFSAAASSFQSRVRPQGERLAELGGGEPGKTLPDITPLDPPTNRLL